MMNNKEFADKAVSMAKNYKIAYVWGSFGHTNTQQNINRLLAQYPENYEYLSKMKQAQFFSDCSGAIKAIIWDWNGDSSKVYGGASYCSNGLNDVNAEMLRGLCTELSTDFSNIQIGELVFNKDASHVGIYVGNGCCVEATPSFSGYMQITGLGNKGPVAGLNTRTWSSHGKLSSYVNYSSTSGPTTSSVQHSLQVAYAQYFDKNLAGQYTVQTGGYGLNLRKNSSISAEIIKAFPDGTHVMNYGYYSIDQNGVKWLLVMIDGYKGFMSTEFLIK